MSAARCPYCLGALDETRDAGGVVHCAKCGTPHHGACFGEHAGCTIYGCGSLEVRVVARRASGDARIIDISARAGALHPFLPLLQSDRPRRFLAVEQPEVVALFPGRRVRARFLRLHVPAQVDAEGRVTGSLEVTAPADVLGQGLRLCVEAWLEGAKGPVLVDREEAVLAGRPARGWLERLNLWSRAEPIALLAAGTTTVRFAFDAAPWAWTAPLPEGARWGPRLSLRVSAVLDAEPATSTRAHPILVRVTRPPLVRIAPEDEPVDLPLWPPLATADWCARPLVVPAGENLGSVGVFAVRRGESSSTASPGITLEATAAPGTPRIEGTVTLVLGRAGRRRGAVVLTCFGERRVGQGAWERVSGERALVCDRPARRAEGAGRHAFEFEYAPPWPARTPPDDEARRVCLRATVVGSGHELKSAVVAVVLRRRRRSRAQSDGATRGETT